MGTGDDSERVVKWSTGPENSRLVRGLLYLALGATIAELVLIIGLFLIAALILYDAYGPVRGVGISLAAILLVGAIALRKAVDIYGIWWDDWRVRSFYRAFRFRWAVVSTALITALVIALGLAWNIFAPFWITLLLSGISLVAAYVLSDRGTFRPDSRVLMYGDEWELDLNGAEITRRASIGPHTFVWISDVPKDSATSGGFYVLPTEIIESLDSQSSH